MLIRLKRFIKNIVYFFLHIFFNKRIYYQKEFINRKLLIEGVSFKFAISKDLSIIIPTFNSSKVILKTINSILDQNIKLDYEIIIVDDASTDDTVAVLYSLKNSKIKVIRKETNSGPGNSINVGIENSCGEYLVFLDSDDFMLENSIVYMYETIKKNQVDYLVCAIKTASGKKINKLPSSLVTSDLDTSIKFLTPRRFGKIFNRNLFLSVKQNESTMIGEDLPNLFVLPYVAKDGMFSNEVVYEYNDNNDNSLMSTHTKFDLQKAFNFLISLNYISNYYVDNNIYIGVYCFKKIIKELQNLSKFSRNCSKREKVMIFKYSQEIFLMFYSQCLPISLKSLSYYEKIFIYALKQGLFDIWRFSL